MKLHPLEACCTVITDGTHYTPKGVSGGIPFLTVKDIIDSRLDFANCSFISETDFERANTAGCAPNAGDVLFSKDGTVGKVHRVQESRRFAVLSSIAILRADPTRLMSSYLSQILKTPEVVDQATERKTGSAIRRIILSDLKKIRIPLPPLPEQQRIAAILDQAEALQAKRRQALAKLDTLTQSLFLEMFGHDTYKDEPLAAIVKHGTIVTYGIVQAGEEVGGGVPYIRTGDIKNGRIDSKQLRHTAPEIAARFSRSRVSEGDLVMSIRATVGTVAKVSSDLEGANLTQGTARIAPGNRIDGTYLLYYLRSTRAQRWIQREVKGATFREVTLEKLRQLPIQVPPIEDQTRFARTARQVQCECARASKSEKTLIKLFSTLQHRAFRGEL